MEYHSISLQPLYKRIREIHQNPVVPPTLPKRGTDLYSEYSYAFEQIIKDVSGQRAVYLWFNARQGTDPEYIYIGKSDNDRDGLRGRFRNEFRQWYHIFWMKSFESDKYVKEVISLYTGKDYTKEVNNQALKHGASHIVYCPSVAQDADIAKVEKDLIQLFGNPRGNNSGLRRRPLGDNDILPLAKMIYQGFVNICGKTIPYAIFP